MLLEVEGVSKRFGGLRAVHDVSFGIGEGEILGLIGPNGAGKTTLFNVIAGLNRPDRGSIRYKGEDITGLASYRICQKGIARTFQIVRPIKNMSVIENIAVGGFVRRNNLEQVWAKAEEIARFLGLSGMSNALVKNLNLLSMKRLEVARALATEPQLLLLDESFGGLNPIEVQELIGMMRSINKEWGITVLMIEHVMGAIMQLATRIIVLSEGRMIAEGSPAEIQTNPEVLKVYFGGV